MRAFQRRRPWRYVATAALLVVPSLAVLIGARPAAAAVIRHVAVGGSDAANNCTVQASPCATITHAATVSVDGDSILVGPGTFAESVAIPATPTSAKVLTITGSPLGTTVQGGALPPVFSFAAGTTATLAQLTVTGGAENGGVVNNGSATLFRVAVTGNGAGLDFGFGEGGGINNAVGATLQLLASTVANNHAFGQFGEGGGIMNRGTMTITDSTIAGNGAGLIGGGGIANHGTASIAGTIISGNTAGGNPSNCSGPITDNGQNLDSGITCGFGGTSQSGVDPMLGPLVNNGGPTQTMAIPATSPAVDTGRPGCTVVDQRRVPCPQGPQCDVGAYEFSPGVITGLTPNSGPEAGGTIVTITGQGFTYAGAVTFGAASAIFSVVNDTTINTQAPPGTGAVFVHVATPDGSGPDSAASTFTYVSAVHASSLTANPLIARVQPFQLFFKLSAQLVDVVTSTPAVGQIIEFSARGRVVCTAVTSANGTAACAGVPPFFAALFAGGYSARFAGSGSLTPATASAGLVA